MRMKMMLVFCLLFMMSSFTTIHADMGPKSNIIIYVESDEETYYMALLTPYNHYGPYREDLSDLNILNKECEDVACKFKQQAALDDYHLINDIETLHKNDTYSWNYLSPDIFKIVLYFPESDQFFISESYEKYAFQNTYRLIINEQQGTLELIEDYDYSSLFITFFICCSTTLLIELLIALLFNYRNREDFIFIIKINVLTQILLHVYLQFMVYQYDFFSVLFYYLFAEIAILFIEAFLYWKHLKANSFPIIYSIVANASSFLLGSYLLKTILYLIHY